MPNYVNGKGGLARLLRQEMGFRRYRGNASVGDFIVNCGTDMRGGIEQVINGGLTFNKHTQVTKMQAAGIDCPESGTTQPARQQGWIIKPYNSQGGRGIHRLADAPGRVTRDYYYQREIDKVREFRGHVALWLPNDIRCFSIQEKVMPDDRRGELCWNHDMGSRFKRSYTPESKDAVIRRAPLFGRIADISVRACRAVGHDFGAVDILMDRDRKLWVIEINTRPGIDGEPSKDTYRYAFERLAPVTQEARQPTVNEQAEQRRREAEERDRRREDERREERNRVRLMLNTTAESVGGMTDDEIRRLGAYLRRYPFNV